MADGKTPSITDIFESLGRMRWATDPMTVLQISESLEMPQIGKVVRTNVSDIRENDYLLLQSVYDRYVILGTTGNQGFIIPDWYRALVKVRSSHPKIQRQFWNFQGASEINRFDLPREINFLVETPIYQFVTKTGAKADWRRVVVKRNTKLLVTKMYNYSVEGNFKGACFILVDKKGTKFMLPSEFNVKFSVEIRQDEYNSSYFDDKGTFTLPEVITRYELPVEIEFTPGTEAGSVPAAKLPRAPMKMMSVAIAKSVIAVVFNTTTKKLRYVELSPSTPIKLAIPKCLHHGLLNPNAQLTKDEENEYNFYSKTRESILGLCHKQCELYKFDMRPASNEERDAMMKIYEAGLKYKKDELVHLKDNYLLDLKSKEAQNPDAKIPFIALRNIFLRPNIDEGDPYDDVNQEANITFTHDLTILPSMPEKLTTDPMTDIENVKSSSKN